MTPRRLRTAFRKAAKATHPDINPDHPDAALRFRELVRAYDILTDTEQRETYDQLLAIALQPQPATKAVRTYEVIGNVASNTMAATVISAVLVGSYVLFGMFSKPPGAAEIATDRKVGEAQFVAALHPDITAPDEPRVQHEGDASTVGPVATSGSRPQRKRQTPLRLAFRTGAGNSPRTIRGFDIIRASEPPISTAGSSRIASAISTPLRRSRSTESDHGSRRAKIARPAPRKPLAARAPCAPCATRGRMPITAALTP